MEELGDLLRRTNPRITSQMNTPTSSSTEPAPDPSATGAQAEEERRFLRRQPPPALPHRGPSAEPTPLARPIPCPDCGGAGYVLLDVPVGHPDFGRAIPCHCKQEELAWRRTQSFQSMSNLTALARYTFDNFIPQPTWLARHHQIMLQRAYEVCFAFAQEPSGWLLLTGGYGCGKTHLAAAIANARLDRGQPALFVVVPDLLDHLRTTFGPESHITYDELFEQVRTTRLLILDDLGAQSTTPWAQEKLYQILNHRYNAQLPTVITTNQRLEDIDQRLRSRLGDINLVERVHINTPDFRSGAKATQSDLSTLSFHQEQHFHNFDVQRPNMTPDEIANTRRILEVAMAYAEEPRGWLVLMGPSGRGKTHLAAAIANRQREHGQTDAMFVVVPDLLDYLRAAFNPQAVIPYDRRFEEVKKAPLLVLDDLGVESATPWAREKLFQLLNYRYNAVLPTVITTSAAPNEIEPWLRTRMFDQTRCTVCVFESTSRSKKEEKGGSRRSGRRY
ncbi:MAG: AAA family ATPase [Caldilineae bacterium]|nr:MAG: AAA family ATPase [Caldilineae bacterium]